MLAPTWHLGTVTSITHGDRNTVEIDGVHYPDVAERHTVRVRVRTGDYVLVHGRLDGQLIIVGRVGTLRTVGRA
jgi:hypothetical protein